MADSTHVERSDQQKTEAQVEPHAAAPQVAGLAPSQLPPPAEMAAQLAQRPDRQAVLMELQRTAGNAYVQAVVAAAPTDAALSEPLQLGGVGGGDGDGAAPKHEDVSVTVRLPPNPTQKDVVHAIARSAAFGFQDADIAALDAKGPSFLYVELDNDTKAASAAELAKAVDPRSHLLTINVRGQDAAALEALKATRATGSIDAATFGAPAPLRAALRPLLAALLGPAGAKRIEAAENLANLIEDGENAAGVAAALDALTAAGYTTDPMVAVLRGLANAKAAQASPTFVGPTTTPGIRYPELAKTAEREADEASADIDAQQAAGGANRDEGRVVFDLSARLHGKTGNRQGKADATMMSRMFDSTENERNRARKQPPGSVIEADRHEQNSIGPRSETDLQMDDLKERVNQFADGKEVELKKTEVPEAGKKNWAFERDVANASEGRAGVALEEEEERAAERAEQVMGGFALVKQAVEFVGTLNRMEEGTRLIAEQDRLTQAQWREHHYPVPPHVEDLVRVLEELAKIIAAGGKAAPAAQRHAEAVRHVLRFARAFWNAPTS